MTTYQSAGLATKEEITQASHSQSSIHKRGKAEGTVQVVEFVLGRELFAIDLFDTREVITNTMVTPLPSAPAFIRGIIDLRGMITTIIDLKDLMHIQSDSGVGKKTRIIVLDRSISHKPIGILVDDVYSVTTYGKDEIDKDTESASTDHKRDILGVIRKRFRGGGDEEEKHELVIWLDIKGIIRKIEDSL